MVDPFAEIVNHFNRAAESERLNAQLENAIYDLRQHLLEDPKAMKLFNRFLALINQKLVKDALSAD